MVVAASAAVGALGLAGGGTAAGILGARLVRSDGAAGVPLACVVVGSAVAALALSRLSARMGRGPALAAGYLAGCAGAAAVVAAADLRSFPLLATGCVPYGAGNAAIFLTRYAAAEFGGPAGRGRALAAVLFGTAAGAVASPALLGPTGALAGAVGVEPLAGMFLAAAIVYAAAAALLAGLSLARVSLRRPAGAGAGRRELAAGLGARRARFAIAVLALVNLLMVGIMAVAPVRLAAGGHGLRPIGAIVSVHVAGMFVPAPVSGWAADRLGPGAVAAAGLCVLVAAGVGGSLASEADVPATAAALLALGLGWNLGVVGGSAMLIGSVPARVRPDTEGIGEAAMGLAAAVGAPVAGLVVALFGLAAAWLGVAVAAVAALVPAGARPAMGRRRRATPRTSAPPASPAVPAEAHPTRRPRDPDPPDRSRPGS